MVLKEQITKDMKAARHAKDVGKLGAIRLIMAAIKQKEVHKRVVLDDAQVQAIFEKMIKQHKDSIAQFEGGSRQDLVEIEKSELDVLGAAYIPAAASDEKVQAEVSTAIAATAAGPQDMEKVMCILKGKLADRADMTLVSSLVKAALTKA